MFTIESASSQVSASDWIKGITLSILASMIGGASKLAIRKSWLLQREIEQQQTPIPTHHAHVQVQDDEGEEATIIVANNNEGLNNFNTPPRRLVQRGAADDYEEVDDEQIRRQKKLKHSPEPHHFAHGYRYYRDRDINSENINNEVDAAQIQTRSQHRRTNSAIIRQLNSFSGNSDSAPPTTSLPATTTTTTAATATINAAAISAPAVVTVLATSSSFEMEQGTPCSNSSSSSSSDASAPNSPLSTDVFLSPLRHRYPRALSVSAQQQQHSLWLPYALRVGGMIGMTFLNPLCGVLAMNYASPSITAPFSGLTLVWIVAFSKPVIQEEPSRGQVIAASLIVLGEVVVAVYGDHTNDENVTIQDVQNSYRNPLFLFYFVVMALWMLLLWRWMHKPNPSSSSNSSSSSRSSVATATTLRRFAWGVAGGSITGLQNFLKDALTIVKAMGKNTGNETTAEFPWYLILFLILAVATAFSGLLFLTACMKRYDATYSSAMFVGSFVVSASIMSAIHYQTFQHLPRSFVNYIMYPLGLLVLMGGVYLLVQEASKDDDDNDNGNNNENAVGGIGGGDEFMEIHLPRQRLSRSSIIRSREQSMVSIHDSHEPLFSEYDNEEQPTGETLT